MADTSFMNLLGAARAGATDAREELWRIIYRELHDLAEREFAHQRPGHTLQATALVNEAFLRLSGRDGERDWDSKAHFYGAAARAMRNVLVDQLRRRRALKRGGGERIVEWTDAIAAEGEPLVDLIDLDIALDKLERERSRSAQIVHLRYFAGLTIEDCARVLELSTNTIDREWSFAKAWLHRELSR